jgi:lysozyme
MTNAISAHGLALIQQYEGFSAEPVQLPDGNWVVGHGHVRVAQAGAAVSEAEAADLLSLDLAPVELMVNERVCQTLTQSQFDALVSFAFSVGADAFEQSQVFRRTNAGDFIAAACAMDAWRKSDVGGEAVVVDVLVCRRSAEKALYLKDLPHDASPSAFMRAKLDFAASVLGAPVVYAAAPAVGSVPMARPKLEPAVRLVEILKSEPATEALLLTQVVANNDDVNDGEIVTAHAKPVARAFDDVPVARRRPPAQAQAKANRLLAMFKREDLALVAEQPPSPDQRIRNGRDEEPKVGFQLPQIDFNGSFETIGLIALVLFGVVLVFVGGSLVVGDQVDVVSMAAAAAVIAPGVAAILIGAVGLLRGPLSKPLGI